METENDTSANEQLANCSDLPKSVDISHLCVRVDVSILPHLRAW